MVADSSVRTSPLSRRTRPPPSMPSCSRRSTSLSCNNSSRDRAYRCIRIQLLLSPPVRLHRGGGSTPLLPLSRSVILRRSVTMTARIGSCRCWSLPARSCSSTWQHHSTPPTRSSPAAPTSSPTFPFAGCLTADSSRRSLHPGAGSNFSHHSFTHTFFFFPFLSPLTFEKLSSELSTASSYFFLLSFFFFFFFLCVCTFYNLSREKSRRSPHRSAFRSTTT